jgi:hypothetical protein
MKLVGGAEANHSKFLVFIRDPVDRIASQQNNQARRFGDKKNFEEDVRRLASNVGWSRMLRSLSYQGAMLANLLSVVFSPKNILIIPMTAVKGGA